MPLAIPPEIDRATQGLVDSPQPTSEEIKQAREQEDAKKLVFDFPVATEKLRRLVGDWSTEITKTNRRRKLRSIDIDVNALRRNGDIKPDDSVIPIRTIDTNIRREQPPYIAYLKQSRRLAIFKSTVDPQANTDVIEDEFTRGMTYSGWEIPHFKVLDGAQAHGWDFMEVEFDQSKPLHVGLSHVGHDNLIFPLDARDIQACESIVRVYHLSVQQLVGFVEKYGFNKAEVDKLVDKGETKISDRVICVYKRFTRWEGVVYVSWFSLECNDWLKAPQKLFLGRAQQVEKIEEVDTLVPRGMDAQGNMIIEPMKVPTPVKVWEDIDETKYPVIPEFYYETEDQKISEHKGRCFLDEYKQEASTATWSAFISALNRASNVYGSAKTPSGSAPRQSDILIEHGALYTEPVEFFHTDYPNPVVLQALEQLETQIASERNDIAWTVNNRQDSRKTAKEVDSAEKQANLINSVQVTLYSTFIRDVYNLVWLIVQSQALQGKITFLAVADPMTGEVTNNMEVIGQLYDIRAAGDIDVIQRQEKLLRIGNFLPLVQGTPLYIPMLIDALKIAFPEDAARYAQILSAGDLQKQSIMKLSSIIDGLEKEGAFEGLPPETTQQLEQIKQEAVAALAAP